MLNVLIVSTYLIVVLFVGIYYSQRITTMRQFSLSGQVFSGPIILATISATYIGAGFVFGYTGQAFKVGIPFLFPLAGCCLSKIIIGKIIVPKMTRFENAMSIGDVMSYDYKMVGSVVTGIASCALCLGFAGAQISAVGLMFKQFFSIDYTIGIIIACLVLVVYSSLGGFRAVALTDVVQFGVLIIALPLICNLELVKIGGLRELLSSLPQSHIIPSADVAFDQFLWFLLFVLPWLDPAAVQRILMDKDSNKVSKGFYLSALLDIPIFLVIVTIGLIALVTAPDLDPNLSFVYVISKLPDGVQGFAIAGVLAIVMSTADSCLHAAGVSFVHDVIGPFKGNLSDHQELRLSQIATGFLGLGAIYCSFTFPKILDMIMYFQNMLWMPLIMAPLYATILGLRANAKSFIISCICGMSMQMLGPWLFSCDRGMMLSFISLSASASGLLFSHIVFKHKMVKSYQ